MSRKQPNYEELAAWLKELEELKIVSSSEGSKNDLLKEIEKSKLAIGKKLLGKVVVKTSMNEVPKDEDYVELYKQVVAPKLKSINENNIKNKVYSL